MKKLLSIILIVFSVFALTGCDGENPEIPRDTAPSWLSGDWKPVAYGDSAMETFNIDKFLAQLDAFDLESENPERMMIAGDSSYEVHWTADSRGKGFEKLDDPYEYLLVKKGAGDRIYIERQSQVGEDIIYASKGYYKKAGK